MKRFYFYLQILTYFLVLVASLQSIILLKEIMPLLWHPFEIQLSITFIIPAIKITLLCYLIYILVGVYSMAKSDSEKGIFSIKNINGFKRFGKACIFYTILKLGLDYFENWSDPNLFSKIENGSTAYTLGYNIGYTLGETLSSQMPMLLLALFFFMLAELAKDGYQIKKENDLTI